MFFKRLLATKYWLGSRFIPKRAGHYILKYNKLMDEIERERRTAFCVGRINDKANCVTKNKIIPRVPCDYGVLVDGPFATSYSLAECNRSLAKGMLEIGHEASLSDYASQHFATVDDLAANGIDADLAYDRSREIHVYLRNTYPPKVRGMNGEFNAYSCYGWEETRFLPEYVSVFNEKLDAVFTTSNFVTKVLQDSGVTVPVFTVGNGVDNWERAAEQPYEVPHKKFVFLHVSSCFPRKSPEVVVSAYEKAFTCDDDVTLIIKTFKNPHNHITELIEERKAQNPKFPDLRLIEDDLSIGQLKSLVNQSDIAVLPSRGEGFGLPHAQAFLSGIPIVTVNWSGPADFCSKDSAFFVDYKLSKAQSHFAIEQSLWADPDPDHLMRVMKEVVDVPKARLKRMADTGRDIILCTYTWKAVAERIDRVVRNLPDMPAVPALNVGWISSWNVRCGIAEYSSYELINFPVPVTVLACEDVNFAKDGENVVRCWRKYDSLGKLKNVVSEKKFNVVVIQYHPGFFDENELSDLIDYLHGLNSVVVAVLHNTSKLSCLNKLALADRLLVHSIDDVNHLKNIGIVENVALYQLGVYIPEFCRADFYGKIGGGDFIVATFGFCLPHKGVREVIAAMALLRERDKKWHKLKLIMCNSVFDSIESGNEMRALKKLIADYGLQRSVELHDEFMDPDDAMRKLREAEMVIFPYQKTDEGASGAVRFGMASGRMVMTSASRIFDDIADCVIRLDGYDAECFADGIQRYFDNKQDERYGGIRKQCYEWVREHDFRKVAGELEKLIYSLWQEKWFKMHGLNPRLPSIDGKSDFTHR